MYLFTSLLAKFNIRCKRFTKYDSEKYADIKTICGFLGQALSLVLPSFHTLTRCDTASYTFRVRKVRIVNELLNKPAGCSLLAAFEKEEPLIENNIEDWKYSLPSLPLLPIFHLCVCLCLA